MFHEIRWSIGGENHRHRPPTMAHSRGPQLLCKDKCEKVGQWCARDQRWRCSGKLRHTRAAMRLRRLRSDQSGTHRQRRMHLTVADYRGDAGPWLLSGGEEDKMKLGLGFR